MDVKSAYLNSPINAEIYMFTPGYGQKGKVAKVNRQESLSEKFYSYGKTRQKSKMMATPRGKTS